MFRMSLAGGLLAASLCALAARGGVPDLTIETVASGLDSPMYATHAPDDPSRIFVLERAGRVRIVRDGVLLPEPFIDLGDEVSTLFEGGLLGLAFDPGYAANGRVFVHYTVLIEGVALTTRVVRFERDPADADATLPGSKQLILEFDRFSSAHNGGTIAFSPLDGHLYLATGDSDIPQFAQQLEGDGAFFGKILRLDVSGADAYPEDPLRNYAIPAGNPFVDAPGADEIWAYGLRNPFRASFDRDTGDLWIGDVGEASWEEIDFQPADDPGGRNYGWDCMEGAHCTSSDDCVCNAPELVLPVHEYDHSQGCSVTGGVRYRGCTIPELQGRYIFSDFCGCAITHFAFEGGDAVDVQPGGFFANCNIVGIGEDYHGEILLCSLSDGSVSRIVPVGDPEACPTTPGDLNDDGVVNAADLALMLAAWGDCPRPCPPDLDQDGDVDSADLAQLLASWT